MNTHQVEIFNIKYEYFIYDDMAKNSIGNNKAWEPHITKFIKLFNKFNKIQNIIDVGANFGYHTLLFSKEVEGNVYSFEPQIQNFDLLQKNINNNNIKNVTIYNLACSNEKSEILMPVISKDNTSAINMGDFTPNVINNNCFSITKTILLDDIIFPKIDLIKIDVQGWEKKVIMGSLNLLKIHKPILIIEFESKQLLKTNTTCEELFNFIRNNNYYIYYLEYEYPSDHICVHNDNLNDFKEKFKQYIFPHELDNDINHNIKFGINEKIVL
jgi:FkbM family methyltransferase